MPNYVKAKYGYKFVLTVRGLEESRVRSKFEITNPNYKLYCKAVPRLWLEKGYVVEVKENYDDC